MGQLHAHERSHLKPNVTRCSSNATQHCPLTSTHPHNNTYTYTHRWSSKTKMLRSFHSLGGGWDHPESFRVHLEFSQANLPRITNLFSEISLSLPLQEAPLLQICYPVMGLLPWQNTSCRNSDKEALQL